MITERFLLPDDDHPVVQMNGKTLRCSVDDKTPEAWDNNYMINSASWNKRTNPPESNETRPMSCEKTNTISHSASSLREEDGVSRLPKVFPISFLLRQSSHSNHQEEVVYFLKSRKRARIEDRARFAGPPLQIRFLSHGK
jgi:hypothetical protein